VSIVYGAHNEFELVLAVAPTPFYVALKVNGKTAIQMNSLGYLNFEQYRQRNPRPAPAPAAPPAEGEGNVCVCVCVCVCARACVRMCVCVFACRSIKLDRLSCYNRCALIFWNDVAAPAATPEPQAVHPTADVR